MLINVRNTRALHCPISLAFEIVTIAFAESDNNTFCRQHRQETTLVECYVVVSTNEEMTSKMNDEENVDNNGFPTHTHSISQIKNKLITLFPNRIIFLFRFLFFSTNQLFNYVRPSSH